MSKINVSADTGANGAPRSAVGTNPAPAVPGGIAAAQHAAVETAAVVKKPAPSGEPTFTFKLDIGGKQVSRKYI